MYRESNPVWNLQKDNIYQTSGGIWECGAEIFRILKGARKEGGEGRGRWVHGGNLSRHGTAFGIIQLGT